jgi:hypothetical protein
MSETKKSSIIPAALGALSDTASATAATKSKAKPNGSDAMGSRRAPPCVVVGGSDNNATATDTTTTTSEGAASASTAAAAAIASRDPFDEAMAVLPHETTAAYVEAVRVAPHLVEAESNPDIYLAFHKNDPWKAALCVATYWKMRAEIFGGDRNSETGDANMNSDSNRAYRPMTLTGDGAMSPDDVKVFKTGFLMVLPRDRHGRAVVRWLGGG